MKRISSLLLALVLFFSITASNHAQVGVTRDSGKLYRANETIVGDILINGDTQNDKVILVYRGQNVNYSATIDASVIYKQYNEIYDNFVKGFAAAFFSGNEQSVIGILGAQGENINIKDNLKSEFTVKIIPDANIEFSGAATDYTFSDADWFPYSVVKNADGSVDVTMTLDTSKVTTYADLRSFLESKNGGFLTLTTNAKVLDTASCNVNMTTVGQITGTFESSPKVTTPYGQKNWLEVTTIVSGHPNYADVKPEEKIVFNWTGIQDSAKADFILPATATIQGTVKVACGDVVVKYVNEDGVEIKELVELLKDAALGTAYDASTEKPLTITFDGVEYEFVLDRDGNEKGEVVEGVTTVTYVYKVKETVEETTVEETKEETPVETTAEETKEETPVETTVEETKEETPVETTTEETKVETTTEVKVETKKEVKKESANPKTGDAGIALSLVTFAVAGGASLLLSKKRK